MKIIRINQAQVDLKRVCLASIKEKGKCCRAGVGQAHKSFASQYGINFTHLHSCMKF